jgi:predicted amidohydrolase YtcJ
VTRILLRGGRVLTSHPAGASAVLVEDDRIVWIGTDATALPPVDRVVELEGRLVTPAFVDAHVHLAATGLGAMGADLSGTRSAGEALDLLAVHAGATSLAVVLGHSWDETGWPGGALFTRAELDRAVAGRPAYLSRVDMHSAYASTALLEDARLHHDQPASAVPGWSEDGAVSRDAHHHVREAMLRLLTPDDRAAAIRLALQTAASRGVGMVHEMGAPHINDPGDLVHVDRVRTAAAAAGGALPEVVAYWGELGTDVVLAGGMAGGIVGAAGDLCVDGAIGSRTAALESPYADEPGTSGYLYLTADEIADHVVSCTSAGLQAGFHVIGDRASAEVVAGFEKAAARLGADALRTARHRLEHVEMVRADHREALGALGVVASMQPLFDHWWGGQGGLYETRLGDRARGMNAFASLDRAGVRLAFGSDTPVTPFDPWASVRAAVLHHDQTERVSAATAFEAHTVGGWYAARRDEGGRLEPGAPAYLAVWDAPGGDPLATIADPDHPLPVCVLTLVAGAVAYDGGGLMS